MIDVSKKAHGDLGAVEIAVKNSFIELWNNTAPKGKKWEDNPTVEIYDLERVKYERD